MNRFISVLVPPSTLESNAVLQLIPMQHGTIQSCTIILPPGCAALVHVQVFCHGEQVAPWNKTGSIVGNDLKVLALKDYLLDQPPYELIAKLWNLDDTYPHTVLIDIYEDDKQGTSQLGLLLEGEV